jgi:hypothetical protein
VWISTPTGSSSWYEATVCFRFLPSRATLPSSRRLMPTPTASSPPNRILKVAGSLVVRSTLAIASRRTLLPLAKIGVAAIASSEP